jgi:hypothetical protein
MAADRMEMAMRCCLSAMAFSACCTSRSTVGLPERIQAFHTACSMALAAASFSAWRSWPSSRSSTFGRCLVVGGRQRPQIGRRRRLGERRWAGQQKGQGGEQHKASRQDHRSASL